MEGFHLEIGERFGELLFARLGVIMKKMRLAHVAEPLLNLGRQYGT